MWAGRAWLWRMSSEGKRKSTRWRPLNLPAPRRVPLPEYPARILPLPAHALMCFRTKTVGLSAQVELAPDLLSVLSDENSSLTSRSRQKWAEAMGELVQRNAHVYGFFSSTAILHETIHRESACHLNYKTFNVDTTVSDVAVEQQYIGACSGPETHI